MPKSYFHYKIAKTAQRWGSAPRLPNAYSSSGCLKPGRSPHTPALALSRYEFFAARLITTGAFHVT